MNTATHEMIVVYMVGTRMVESKQELYGLISDDMSWDAFEKEIDKRYTEYDTLFDKDTIALLLVDEMGRYTHSVLSLSDLHPGIEATIVGTITYADPVKTFQRKNGGSGRYVRCGITDETGSCVLLLWNEDTKLVESNKIQPGSTVKIINGYTKKGYHGVEVHVGKWSSVETVNGPIGSVEETEKGNTSLGFALQGKIDSIEATRAFFKDDGSYGFVTTITLITSDGMEQVTFWDEKVKQLQGFKKGDRIKIENVDTRKREGTLEYHVNGKALIKKD